MAFEPEKGIADDKRPADGKADADGHGYPKRDVPQRDGENPVEMVHEIETVSYNFV